MNIQKIQHRTYNSNPQNFTSLSPKAVQFCEKLDKQFLCEAKKQGFVKTTIVSIIERMQLSPKFEAKSLEEICTELMQKFREISEQVAKGKNAEELSSMFKFGRKTATSIIHQQELVKRNAKIVESFNQGHSLREISKEFNVAGETIRLVLRDAGINLKEHSARIYKRIADMFAQGFNELEIAKEIKWSPSTINAYRNKLRFMGEEVPTRTEAKHGRIIEMLKQGIKRKDIAKETNLKIATINKIAQKNHVGPLVKAEQKNAVLEYLKYGFPTKEIAKRLGISTTTIVRIAQKHNIDLKIDFTVRNQAIIEALKTKNARIVAKDFNLHYQTVLNIKYFAKKQNLI